MHNLIAHSITGYDAEIMVSCHESWIAGTTFYLCDCSTPAAVKVNVSFTPAFA